MISPAACSLGIVRCISFGLSRCPWFFISECLSIKKFGKLQSVIKQLTLTQKQERLAELLFAVKQRNIHRIEALLESGSVAVLNDKLAQGGHEEIDVAREANPELYQYMKQHCVIVKKVLLPKVLPKIC